MEEKVLDRVLEVDHQLTVVLILILQVVLLGIDQLHLHQDHLADQIHGCLEHSKVQEEKFLGLFAKLAIATMVLIVVQVHHLRV